MFRRAVFVCFGLSLLGADLLSFGAFSLETGVTGLIDQFPKSSHLFWFPDGHAAEFREIAANSTGHYIIRILPEEVRQDVYYVDAALERGAVTSIRLSLEKPDDGSSFEARHPQCAPLLAGLTRRYGKPAGPQTSWEERLENRKYVWKNDREELALACGRYSGRTRVFAMDVILKRLGN